MLRCPGCGNTKKLHIYATVEVEIEQDKNGTVVGSEPVDGNHGWDDDSVMLCPKCQHLGMVRNFTEEE